MWDGSQTAGGVLLKNGSEDIMEHYEWKEFHPIV